MTALRARLGRGGSLLLLPLSILPFLLIGPSLVDSHAQFQRDKKSHALPAPAVVLSAAELARWKPLPAFGGAVPVIRYEGVGDGGPRSVTQLQLGRQLAMLTLLGFRSISIRQYVRWRSGKTAGMPQRPVLITFDGGRLSSFRGADRLLQRYGAVATMFVPTARIASRDRELLTWKELHGMQASGRWDVQAEGTHGDARVVKDPSGDMAPAYAFRRYTNGGGFETYADWQTRVTRDVFAARDALVAQGFEPAAFAVPGGDLGETANNDARIPTYVRSLVATQFGPAFVRNDRNYPAFSTPGGNASRLEIGRATTADSLYAWLRAKDPAR
ncbi:MAG: poly-beta,6-N-acetyl-D-glucosamine N-deacetylase [Thermoleophilaceae bacterium]|nr:poly-beta,6-N-acetyl-D-glucosamine N-deacetylase [Thermoleophilaceae bacterium]